MGLSLDQLQTALAITKDYSDTEVSDAEKRVSALLQALYEVINGKYKDPLQVQSGLGIEDTPVGHIMAFMGKTAPRHYLSCEGQVLNISAYPALSKHIQTQFGSVNYFGGNGTTTFALPDLRGEFLRGAGTATRNTGAGGAVGVHQDATRIPNLAVTAGRQLMAVNTASSTSSGNANFVNNQDKNINHMAVSNLMSVMQPKETSSSSNLLGQYGTDTLAYTTRPTNTAVLYCIKYEQTFYLRVGPDAEEHVDGEMRVGTLNGKALYRRLITISFNSSTKLEVTYPLSGVDKVFKIDSVVYNKTSQWVVAPQFVAGTAGGGASIQEIKTYYDYKNKMVVFNGAGDAFKNKNLEATIEILYTKTAYYAVLGIDRITSFKSTSKVA